MKGQRDNKFSGEVVAEYRAGGSTYHELAKKHGVNPYTLKGRVMASKKRTSQRRAPLTRFVPVQVRHELLTHGPEAPVVALIGASAEYVVAVMRALRC